LGEPGRDFDAALERHLLSGPALAAPKVRLYTPRLPAFLAETRHDGMRSWRQRFTWRPHAQSSHAQGEAVAVDERNVDQVERAFGVARRFWRTAADFAARAHGIVVMHRGEPASLCYAAAEVEREAEIDVLTSPSHQRLGLATVAVLEFARRCDSRGVAPLWDCFANNDGSMQLARATGFTPRGQPYAFYTINR
jgi:GNAT superfamily N-acetyltransferase